jgi:transcriptional regulator GlxA family with amidase domain
MRIQILLFDGYDEMDALGPFEVLHAAAGAGANLRPELVRLGSATVTSGFGLQLHVSTPIDPEAPPALLLVPGAGWFADAVPGSWAEAQRARIAAVVAALHGSGAVVAAIGTAVTVLAAAGLLHARSVTADRRVLAEVQAHGAQVVDERVADDGDILSCAGRTSGLDLALWLVERFASAADAEAVEHRLEYERRGGVWRRPDPPTP